MRLQKVCTTKAMASRHQGIDFMYKVQEEELRCSAGIFAEPNLESCNGALKV